MVSLIRGIKKKKKSRTHRTREQKISCQELRVGKIGRDWEKGKMFQLLDE